MLVSSISMLLFGMLLGLRFKVLIVAPASLGAMLFAICVGIMRADVPWKIGLGAAAAIACLQVGYVAGIIILSRLGSGLVPGYNGPSTQVRHAVQKTHGQDSVDLVTRQQDNWKTYANEELV